MKKIIARMFIAVSSFSAIEGGYTFKEFLAQRDFWLNTVSNSA